MGTDNYTDYKLKDTDNYTDYKLMSTDNYTKYKLIGTGNARYFCYQTINNTKTKYNVEPCNTIIFLLTFEMSTVRIKNIYKILFVSDLLHNSPLVTNLICMQSKHPNLKI